MSCGLQGANERTCFWGKKSRAITMILIDFSQNMNTQDGTNLQLKHAC